MYKIESKQWYLFHNRKRLDAETNLDSDWTLTDELFKNYSLQRYFDNDDLKKKGIMPGLYEQVLCNPGHMVIKKEACQ